MAEPTKVICKAHIKDICYTRMYITGHFDAPFENYRLDTAVNDLVVGSGVPRSALMPLTCFLYKNYLFTLNNRRLWVLRHAFMFSGKDEMVDIVVLPDNAFPERKDYVARLPFHKQEAFVHPKFNPLIHGDQPRLQKLVMRAIMFRYETAMRSGYKLLPGNRVLCINAHEAAAAFQASNPAIRMPTHAPKKAADDDDDTMSMTSETPSLASVDFPGRQGDFQAKPALWSSQNRLALPALKESAEEEAEEKEEEKGLSDQKKKDLAEVAQKFKVAVASLRLVLDNLDEAFDKLAA